MRKSKIVAGPNQKNNHTLSAQSMESFGSLRGKFPVVLDGGKTTIYISDKSREAEIVERYNSRTKR